MTNKTKQEAMYEMQHGTHIRICFYLYFIWKSVGNGGKHSLHVFENMFYIHHVRAGGSDGKKSVCSVGDLGSIPELGWSPREGTGNPLQYSCLENPMDSRAWQATVRGVTKSQTRLSHWAPTAYIWSPLLFHSFAGVSLSLNLYVYFLLGAV